MEFQAAFSQFESQVQDLYRFAKDQSFYEYDPDQPIQRENPYPKYVGSGATSTVFAINSETVVKLILGDEHDNTKAENIRGYVGAFALGYGHDGLEQIKAYNDKGPNYAVVCQKAPGDSISCLSPEILDAIPEAPYERLIEAYQALQSLGLRTDHGDNLFYDPEKGFTILDYETEQECRKFVHEVGEEYVPQTLIDKVTGFGANYFTVPSLVFKKKGLPVPEHALKFERVCSRMLGETVSRALAFKWKRRGYRLPPQMEAAYFEHPDYLY